MFYSVGTLLSVGSESGQVIGYIEYRNPKDHDKTWVEYRMKGPSGEWWLSCDDEYKEYSISYPNNIIDGYIGPEWHKVDEGTQVVKRYDGDVDVDPGERATFVEYEDSTEEQTLSVEIWEDGTEYSTGYYVDKEEIVQTGFKEIRSFGSDVMSSFGRSIRMFFIFTAVVIAFAFISGVVSNAGKSHRISKYLKTAQYYDYTTSITGNEKQTADVYKYFSNATTETVAKDIIEAIEGDTESVTQMDDEDNADMAILTKDEYCLIYHPDDDNKTVLVQISSRKYNYTSDNSPYRSSTKTSTWYRSHYYSSGYSKDSSTYSKSPSAYSMYSGDTIHNIGNGYYDSYSSSVRQASVNSRSSSSGGISSGK